MASVWLLKSTMIVTHTIIIPRVQNILYHKGMAATAWVADGIIGLLIGNVLHGVDAAKKQIGLFPIEDTLNSIR